MYVQDVLERRALAVHDEGGVGEPLNLDLVQRDVHGFGCIAQAAVTFVVAGLVDDLVGAWRHVHDDVGPDRLVAHVPRSLLARHMRLPQRPLQARVFALQSADHANQTVVVSFVWCDRVHALHGCTPQVLSGVYSLSHSTLPDPKWRPMKASTLLTRLKSERMPTAPRKDDTEAAQRADAVRAWQDAARARVCTPARGFAGKPTDYVYSWKEACTLADPKGRVAASQASQASKASKAKTTMPTLAATRREIAHLERVVDLHYGGVMPVNEGPMSPDSLPDVVYLMLLPSSRLVQPDPEVRLADVERKLLSTNPHASIPGRFTVLSIVKNALQTGIGEARKPWRAQPAQPTPSTPRRKTA
jgi:hypothetical protein